MCRNGYKFLSKMELQKEDPSLIAKISLNEGLNRINKACAVASTCKPKQFDKLRRDKSAMTYAGLLFNHHGVGAVVLEDGTHVRKCSGHGPFLMDVGCARR